MKPEQQKSLYVIVFKGNVDAIDVANLLGGISQTYDDLIDKDVGHINPEDIHEMMLDGLVNLQENAFWKKHQTELMWQLKRSIRRWREANDLEAEPSLSNLLLAYVIRSSLTDILIDMSYIIGGELWGRQAAKKIRALIYTEHFDVYVQEHRSKLNGMRQQS